MSGLSLATGGSAPRAGSWIRAVPWLGVGAVLLLTTAIRVRLLDVPFERDEGEYAYAGQLLLQGVPPYTLAYNMKLPGTYAAYALSMVLFGQTISGARAGLILVNVASTMLMFVLGRRLLGVVGGLGTAVAFALLSLQTEMLGPFGHATHFVVLPAAAGLVQLLKVSPQGPALSPLFMSGLFFGCALLMKQPGAVFVAFGASWIMFRRTGGLRRKPSVVIKELTAHIGGAALPLATVVAWIALLGVFPKFEFWVVRYAREYTTSLSVHDGWQLLHEVLARIIPQAFVFWVLAAVGLGLLMHRRFREPRRTILLLAFWSFVGVCPGFYFREHYFILALPTVALLVGVSCEAIHDASPATPRIRSAVAVGVLVLAAVQTFWVQRRVFFTLPPAEVSREVYGDSPFPEAVEIGSFLRAHTKSSDRIGVLGSEPEIFFYANRKSATGHIYMYGLMEDQPFAAAMQAEMIREVDAARPAWVVWVRTPTSWLETPRSLRTIIDWGVAFVRSSYDLVGQFVLDETGSYRSYWGAEASRTPIDERSTILIFRRRGGVS